MSPTSEIIGSGPVLVPTPVTIVQIMEAYAKLSGVQMADLVGPSKAPAITAYRHEMMFLIRRMDPAASFSLIGRFIGGRDMATVHEAIAKMELRLQREPDYRDHLVALVDQIRRLAPDDTSQAEPWQLLAACSVLRDSQMTDVEARKTALGFLQQLEVAHG